MLAISFLFEKQFEPWMVGTAKQSGGPGYQTGELRITKPPPGLLMAKQKQQENEAEFMRDEQLSQRRSKKNLTPLQRQQMGLT